MINGSKRNLVCHNIIYATANFIGWATFDEIIYKFINANLFWVSFVGGFLRKPFLFSDD